MSDSTWESYAADEAAAGGEIVVPADVVPILDVAETDTWQAEQATSWADWNAEIADDASANVAAEVAYAEQLYTDGYDGAGDAALARAENSAYVAESHDATAADYAATAASEFDAAADSYATAADYTADAAASYDTTSYDTTSYDTSSTDAGAVDAGYDATE